MFVKVKSIKFVKKDKFYDLQVEKNENYFANGILNHNSGKDWTTSLLFSRSIYKLLCLNDPATHFGFAKGEPIDILNIAVSSEQAKSVFWTKFLNVVEHAGPKAFKQFGFDSKKDIKDGYIKFPKNIRAFSGHSERASLEGKSLLLCVLDEIAEFRTEQELKGKGNRAALSGPAIYNFASSSIRSRFPRAGKLISISYTRFKDDMISQLYDSGLKEPTTYTSYGATWEINPLRKKEDFEKDYRENPEAAKSQYECIPPDAEDPYFPDYAAIDEIIDFQLRRPVFENGVLNAHFRGTVGFRYAIGVDLSIKHDKTALAMVHRENDRYIIDYIRIWRAQPGKEIQIADIENEILLLKERNFNIGSVVFDQYQSYRTLQFLQSKGFSTDKISVETKLEYWNTLKALIQQRNLKAYESSETREFCGELKKLVLVNGKRVDHQGNLSEKDCSDAVLRAIIAATQFRASDITFFEV
jgi:hypothetical protein